MLHLPINELPCFAKKPLYLMPNKMKKAISIFCASLLAASLFGCVTPAVDTNVEITLEKEVDKDGVGS